MTQKALQINDRTPQRIFSLVQAGIWMSFCVSVSFAAVWLQALGYTNASLGVILALGSLMGIACATALSDMIDRNHRVTVKQVIPWVLQDT